MLFRKNSRLNSSLLCLLLLTTSSSFSNSWWTNIATTIRQKLPSILGGTVATNHSIAGISPTSASTVRLPNTLASTANLLPQTTLNLPASVNAAAVTSKLPIATTAKLSAPPVVNSARRQQLQAAILSESAKLHGTSKYPGALLLEQRYLRELAELEQAASEHEKLAILLADDIEFAKEKLMKTQIKIQQSHSKIQALQKSLSNCQSQISDSTTVTASTALRDLR